MKSLESNDKEMDPVDQLKFMLTLSEHLKKLMLLGLLNTKDDSSSELAGFEISKLLTEQRKLENNYADLVKVRASLTGISNKRKMLEIQKEIMDVSKKLKESTKKLCRLFKENPDLESDAIKVSKERKDLINDLEEMISCIQNHSYGKFQNKIFSELEDQDMLRKLTFDEQKLTQEIKSLQGQRAQEQKEYQNEITEKQASIQSLKEKLVYKTERADITKKYRDKESKANEGTQSRIYEYNQKEYKDEIERVKSKIDTETLVHAQLKDFILKKTETLKKKGDERIKLHEQSKLEMEEEKEKLLEVKGKNLEKLEKYRNDFDVEKNRQREKEEEEKRKVEEDKENQLKNQKLDNAIKLIQLEYQTWIDAGGNKKKTKRKKANAKK